MKEKKPVICTQKLHGRPFGVISGLVTKEYMANEQFVISGLFTTKRKESERKPDIEAGKAKFTTLTQKITAELEIANLDPSPENEIENKKICDFQIMLGSEVDKLSDKDFLDVYSALYNP